ncbi:hypothetical protein Sya03_27670 [Spirilliplanes yamanashiensis]|uniref:Uncharacterized protein n=2 Tax=Spirilliplanes yamanashiensis TaxID=42233 RepID=A0A8J3Y902_9ACTN|nr:hypothetical protein [Spirilliplanes yamanashiensis]GIJ03415.1 hypothetical protein Sya03_27670 [Spirilliplanes yamanashiensis]
MSTNAAALAELIRPASGTADPGIHRILPVLPELGGLLPGRGLRRGSTVAIAGGHPGAAGGHTSLMLALLAAASQAGSWCAVAGLPALGVLAAAELGIALDRLALVPHPGPEWPTVVAALLDGVDVVVVAVPGGVSAAVTARLAARARQRGAVLVPYGPWTGADVTLQISHGAWEGLGRGRGRLRRRRVTVAASGRGAAARGKELTVWLPAARPGHRAVPAGAPATARVAAAPPAAPPAAAAAPAAAASAGAAGDSS